MLTKGGNSSQLTHDSDIRLIRHPTVFSLKRDRADYRGSTVHEIRLEVSYIESHPFEYLFFHSYPEDDIYRALNSINETGRDPSV